MQRIPAKIRNKAKKIKLLLLDVDGVLTDGGIVMNDRGEEIKRFDVRDGHGIRLLLRAGIQIALITGRRSKVVSRRARDLGIRTVYQQVYNKLDVYQKIKRKSGLKDQEIAYVGDDIVDLPVLKRVGLAVTVRDAWAELKRQVHYVTATGGGRGAVREIVELLLKAQGRWKELTRRYYAS
ncbi:MAG: 3-deoxy-manno-octulosonate-8-phosphatase KdsC [Deltaproteobacteria bacterium]|nr:3-deoxy-manno-octulosonate-8-phosphatase KdsC [Deltaproteobacteria bacterium]